MTTPTTMTTSMITTGTTMTTDVVVAPSLGELLVGCMLLLTGTVPLVIICSLPLPLDAVERNNTKCHFTWIETQDTKYASDEHIMLP